MEMIRDEDCPETAFHQVWRALRRALRREPARYPLLVAIKLTAAALEEKDGSRELECLAKNSVVARIRDAYFDSFPPHKVDNKL